MISEEQIWNYLDGTLNEADSKEVTRAIETDKEMAALFQEISAMHKALQTETLLSPSPLFADRVMAAVAVAPVKVSIQPLLIFIVPVLFSVVACITYLIHNNITITYTLPSFALPAATHYTLYFILADVAILVYFFETFSEYRLNRKTFFTQQ